MILIIDDMIERHQMILMNIQRRDIISVYGFQEAIKIIDHFAASLDHIYLDHDFESESGRRIMSPINTPGTGSKIAWHLIELGLKIPVTIISKNSEAVDYMQKILREKGIIANNYYNNSYVKIRSPVKFKVSKSLKKSDMLGRPGLCIRRDFPDVLLCDKGEEMKSNEYKCANCHKVFQKEWTDEEASQEAEKKFSVKNVQERDDFNIVCDECFKKIIGN